jgi:hypothetical protein
MSRAVWVGSVMAVVLMVAAAAEAGLLRDDPNAMSEWRGSRRFATSDSAYTMAVDVDFAVYAPGGFGGSSDPSGGTEYLYAYEILNTINSDSVSISSFTVGLEALSQAGNIGIDGGPPGIPDGVTPTAQGITGSSAVWSFLLDQIDYGEDSMTLIYTSPFAPQWMTGSVHDGGLSDEQSMPSPMPEPATIALLVLGGVGGVFSRRRR